ncbi:hypothetical protein ASD89_02055 [Caulobacter sp. Root656]|nr:hypothetical protein ASD89_02055 [Caulobacter sp. Root656]
MDQIDGKRAVRHLKLIRASWQGHATELEGVRLNLDHPELPRDAWQPEHILGSDYTFDDLQAPRLVMPWTDEEDRLWLRARGDHVEVAAGDTIVVAAVRIIPVRADHGDLDHPQHRQRRWAELKVVRADGTEVTIAQAWQFRGLADVMSPIQQQDYKKVYWALLRRLADALGLTSSDDITLASDRSEWGNAVKTAPELYRFAADALWEVRDDVDCGPAMALGYLLGRAESQDLLLPLARRRQEVGEKLRGNAKRPRAKGDDTRRAALKIIEAYPHISRRKCAERTATARNLADVRSIEDTISGLFKRGDDGRYRPDPLAVPGERLRLKMPAEGGEQC